MSFLKVVGKDDGGPHKPDSRLLDAVRDLTARIESGEVTGFVTLEDGPLARDFMVAGDVDLDTMCGFAQRVFSAIARELEE
jgi:hypothetical protein